VDIGSSYLPSELVAAFLWAQLEHLEIIQQKRIKLWDRYYQNLKPLENSGKIKLPVIPSYATNNAHMFYLLTDNIQVRDNFMAYMKHEGINAIFHYLPLHSSPYYSDKHDGRPLPYAQKYSDTLVRLPMFYELTLEQVDYISQKIFEFFG